MTESYSDCSSKGTNDDANDFLFLLQSLQKLRNNGWIDKDRFDFLSMQDATKLLDVLVQVNNLEMFFRAFYHVRLFKGQWWINKEFSAYQSDKNR